MKNINEYLDFAIKMAKEAGEIQKSLFRSNSLSITTKSSLTDVVTEADKRSEALIISEIKSRFPHHSILAEESGITEGEKEWQWVVDPLDGTTNYSQGLPVFSVSIALRHNGETVVGVVFAPYLDELFTAVKGGGAFLNGTPIRCAKKPELARMVVATGMPYDRAENPDNNLDNIENVVNRVRGIRRMGSAAIDTCYVAAGYFDAYWEMGIHEWDVAAGELIALEAGALVERFRDEERIAELVCSPDAYDAFRPLIK